jgi:phage terminase large subunit-like protein
MPRRARLLPPGLDLVAYIGALPAPQRRAALDLLGDEERLAIDLSWPDWAHDGQRAPPACADGSVWRTWVMIAGRGFGKTRAGAEWVLEQIRTGLPLRIALVAATRHEARRIMVEGASGLLAIAGPFVASWRPSLGILRFKSGAEATLFSGASPDALRGPEHHLAWCDELAKWDKPGECWDMLQLGLRLGSAPRALVTTTPRAGAALERIMAAEGSVTTGGATAANPHLPPAFIDAVEGMYKGTRLGEQELEGKLFSDVPGALWTAAMLDACRVGAGMVPKPPFVSSEVETRPNQRPSTALGTNGKGKRLACISPTSRSGSIRRAGAARAGSSPARATATGAAMCSATIASAGCRPKAGRARWRRRRRSIRTRSSSPRPTRAGRWCAASCARRGRAAGQAGPRAGKQGGARRAGGAAVRAGRVSLHGAFPELEAELCGLVSGGDYAGPGGSPDRADAMVWALGEVMLRARVVRTFLAGVLRRCVAGDRHWATARRVACSKAGANFICWRGRRRRC